MGLYPKMEYKAIEQCQPGDLVRLAWNGKSWALIAKDQENGSLLTVFLSYPPFPQSIEPTRQPQLPFYEGLPTDGREYYALCYEKNWHIKINQEGENIKLDRHCSSEYRGALVVKGEQCLLLAGPFNPYNQLRNLVYINLASGELEERPNGPVGAFFNWSLSLHMGGDCFEPLLSFPVGKQA